METRIDILIDASGSMGRETINGEQFILPDGSSRTDLAKRILLKNLKSIIKEVDEILIHRFRVFYKKRGNSFILNKQNQYVISKHKVYETAYKGPYVEKKYDVTINRFDDPLPMGTPLYEALSKVYFTYKNINKQIIVITDGDANDEKEFDEKFLNQVYKPSLDLPIHFIGIDQTLVAQEKCKRIAQVTSGSYVNIEAIDYDVNELNKLLFPIKAKFTQNQLEKATDQEVRKAKATSNVTVEEKASLKKEEDKSKPDSNIRRTEKVKSKDELSHQVAKNSKALSQISIQLENIVALLNGNISEESITIEENPVHNQRVGRKAEKILFKKLKTFNWEIVEWLNEEEESFKSYDFYVENKEHKTYYECKGTAAGLNRFHLTANEWSYYLANRGSYRLCFVQHVDEEPVVYRFMDLLDDLEQERLKLHHSSNHIVKAGSITFFVDVEKCEKF
ncbi:DUF3883 domain-containing protein [Nonlabens mediterrranea]|uniref:DUF3883 domain-containing protein n=1 Tax=Nonlabens mediterrranea TaxID=1419947 RepID=A0ABS0A3G9_9FLAO|nr:DUF3883 domain-containing protein [Nonlabens mediterrranea]